MSADEFENQTPAPIPAHERTWRHPAEIADAVRSDYLATPPPLSRRLTAFAATVSLVASAAILTIAIPKGIAAYRADTDSVQTSQPLPTVAMVKNYSQSEMALINSDKGTTSALSVGNGLWIVAADDIAASTSLWATTPSGQNVPVDIVTTDSDTGLALVRCHDKTLWGAPSDVSHLVNPSDIADLSKYRVVDTATSVTFIPRPSLSTSKDSADIPINSTNTVHGLATVRNSTNQIVGIVVRRGHSVWMLNRASVLRIFRNVSDQP